MERRDVFRILAVGATAPLAVSAAYKPRFFSAEEYESLDRLCETILPADEEGGGAHDAGVAAYIDTVVFRSDPAAQQTWRTELKRVASTAPEKLLELDSDPFFIRLKTLTVEAFFQSKTGLEYLKYKGHSGGLTFSGCTHPEHR